MADPHVQDVGSVVDMDDVKITIGVDYDTVTIRAGGLPMAQLVSTQAEEFAQAFVAACWQAGRNAQRMEHEASDG